MAKESTQEKLNKIMLEYYSILLKEKMEELKKKQEEEKEAEKKINEIQKLWEKFNKLNDKKIIDNVSKILIGNYDKNKPIYFHSIFTNPNVVKFFLDLGIDIEGIFNGFDIGDRYEKLKYFDKYGIEEKLRWDKIKSEIESKLEAYKEELKEREKKETEEKKIKEYKEKFEIFYKLALEKNLHDVTSSHIKNLAVELNEDVSNILNLLTTAVSAKLREHWGTNDPKRRRELTKSTKIEIFRRDGYKCVECGKGKEAKLHVHHIIPFIKGGTDEMENLLTLCESCNMSISDRVYNPPQDWIGRKIYDKWKT